MAEEPEEPLSPTGDPQPPQWVSPEEKYEFTGRTLGEGSFGRVEEATVRRTGDRVAIKSIEKKNVKDKSSLLMEAEILGKVKHRNIVNMVESFQDDTHMYFVLEVAEGGELFKYMQRHGIDEMPRLAPFFMGEVVLALEYLHGRGVLHRDIKPENMLLTDSYHVKLADFGTAIWESDLERGVKFTGTPEYVSPEVLDESKPCRGSDLWALGCVIFQLFVGRPPFQGESEYLLFQEILKGTDAVDFPLYYKDEASPVGSLVRELLKRDPNDRIGCRARGYDELKGHAFFSPVDWKNLPSTNMVTLENKDYTTDLQDYLLQREQVVFSSIVVKTRRLSTKKRQLILTDFPRLFYIDKATSEVKGQVPWSNSIWAEAKSPTKFFVHTPQRVYDFECIFENKTESTEVWVRKINSLIDRRT